MIMWSNFEKIKPPKPGFYLWAQNNWNARNAKGERVHNYHVKTYYWNGREFKDGDNEIIDPDEWAETPFPDPARRPTDDIVYEI